MPDYFPPEILDEILVWLPSKSLCRFRSVSKSWYARITTPSFISSHLNRNLNTHQHTHLLLRVFNYIKKIETFSFYPYHHTLTSLGLPSSTLIPPHKSFIGYHRIVGLCNGLICLTDDIFSDNVGIILWNPSIRKHVTLPDPGIIPDGPHMCMLGFGVDSSNGDVKVVRIVYQADSELNYEDVPSVEVYSLGTGAWRRIRDVGIRQYPVSVTWTPAYLNGCAHWPYLCKNGDFRNLIVSFDMSEEVFREILLPQDIVLTTNSWVVTVYRECLAVIGVDLMGHCFIWVMSEYGNIESWTKLYGVDVELPSLLVGFRKNGDIYMQTSRNELALLDPNERSVVELGIFGSRRAMYANKYVESLVLIDHEILDG